MLTIYAQDIPNFRHKTIQINKSPTNQPKKSAKNISFLHESKQQKQNSSHWKGNKEHNKKK